MAPSGNPISYPAIRTIIPFLAADTRIQAARQIQFMSEKYLSQLPLNITDMVIGNGEFIIDSTVFKLEPQEGANVVELTVNDKPVEILVTNASAEKLMNVLLKKIFDPVRSAKVENLLLKTKVSADIKLVVENVKFGSPNALKSPILGGFDKIIIAHTDYDEIVSVRCPRIHSRSLTLSRPDNFPNFMFDILNAWGMNRDYCCKHWSFEVPSTESYNKINRWIGGKQGFTSEIVNGENRITRLGFPGALKVSCVPVEEIFHLHIELEQEADSEPSFYRHGGHWKNRNQRRDAQTRETMRNEERRQRRDARYKIELFLSNQF